MLCTTPTVEHVSCHTLNSHLNEEFLCTNDVYLKSQYFPAGKNNRIKLDVVSAFAGGRRGVEGAADKDSLHGQSGRAHHPAPDFRQQSCALSL